MSRIPRISRWLRMAARRAGPGWQPAPPTVSASWAARSTGADKGSAVGLLSFRRIVDIPFQTCVAALGSWPARQDGQLPIGQSLLGGLIERDRGTGTCRSRPAWPAARCARRYG